MDFPDEKIIENMNEYKKGQHGNVYEGVYIKEELLEFEEQELFAGKVRVMLPKKFIDMPQSFAEIKYPSRQRPQIIKMDQTGAVNFAFMYWNESMASEQIETSINQIRNVMKKLQASNVFYDIEVKTNKHGMTLGWYDYKSDAIDTKVYNILACLSIEGKMLQFIFNCPFSEMKLWKDVVLQVLDSIHEYKEV